MFELTLEPGRLDLPTLRRVLREPVRLSLSPDATAAIEASVATVGK